ncbi:Predicted arabinose efflux permease, MFS family [Faunimonas pinastri]|uniref:Predicted arabinose efflux permease, MFS family n=1 Tax=Faunimonas pinastri TaxID=1855383 RepID=A0A1H8ZT87_9HYPH|nr:MFS transporter [Faunimonas pinastri]SEP67473.1 Predicted arabinose efflux permease, MFS family [Faunimonas pinastri]
MAAQLLPIFALLVSTTFLLIGNGLHGLLLPLRGTADAFTTTQLGLLGAGYAVGFVAGCILTPQIVRRVGHVRAFGAAASCASVVVLLNGMLVQPELWIALRVVSGFCMAASFMIIESWLNERASNASRGTIFGLYLTVNYVAVMGGQFLVAASDHRTMMPFMLGAIAFSLAVVPTSLSKAASPKPLEAVKIDLRRLHRVSPVAVVTVLLVGLVNGAFGTLAPVFGAQVGLSTTLIATMMGVAIVAGAVMQLPVGRFSDRLDRRTVIAAGSMGAAFSGLLILLVRPDAPWLLLALVGIYGALSYPLYGLAISHANDLAKGENFIGTSAAMLLLYGIGTIIGPVVASWAMSTISPFGLFAVTAGGHGAMALYTVYRTYRRPAALSDQPGSPIFLGTYNRLSRLLNRPTSRFGA